MVLKHKWWCRIIGPIYSETTKCLNDKNEVMLEECNVCKASSIPALEALKAKLGAGEVKS